MIRKKILFAIQGTGNGHICRAKEIIPYLEKQCELTILISGTQLDIDLGERKVLHVHGLGFVFGKKGGIDIHKTMTEIDYPTFRKDMAKLQIEQYDLVINDFEPVSAWACYHAKIPCIALSHQSAFLDKKCPTPKSADLFGKLILEKYAPSNKQFSFHFHRYNKRIYTPIIRKEIRNQAIEYRDHITVYLPAYSDEKLMNFFSSFKQIKWEIFSKHCDREHGNDHIRIREINDQAFVKSMATSQGVLCGAGFETPAEALFLEKKLLVIPMKNQYEQQCNAAALKKMGVTVIKGLKEKHLPKVNKWLNSAKAIPVYYPDETENIIDKILSVDLSKFGTKKRN